MRYSLPLILGVLLLAACGKREAPAPAPAPAPVQVAPAPAPEPAALPAAVSAARTPAAPAAVTAESAKPAKSATGRHVIVSGDSLYEIAKANGVKVSDLKKWNKITDARRLRVGKELRLSAPAR